MKKEDLLIDTTFIPVSFRWTVPLIVFWPTQMPSKALGGLSSCFCV
jgi:hypothetical protein